MEDIKVLKAETFALKIIDLYKSLCKEQNEFVLSKQLLRSGTSIGANIAEASCSESKADFIHKLSISQKEASESKYWLQLLYKSDYINKGQYNELYAECDELLKILSSIIVKLKRS